MLKIFIAGGFDETAADNTEIEKYAMALGAQVIKEGHILLNGCRTPLDRVVAQAADLEISNLDEPPQEPRLISYVLKGTTNTHSFGKIRQSRLNDWELGSPGLKTPEPIHEADAVILLGGYQGTYRAANWARIAGKPLLPISRFGDAAQDIYEEELDRFEEFYESKIDKSDYENLSDMTSSSEELAENVLALAERVKVSNNVFVVMSFSKDPGLEDAYDSFQEMCEKAEYECSRVDNGSSVPRIFPEILTRIKQAAFIIIDLTDEKLNVYYELGYAEALEKPIIVTAKKGTDLPFDVKDIPVIFWKNQKGLKKELSKKIAEIAQKQGR